MNAFFRKGSVAVLLGVALCTAAVADDFRIGLVNVDRVLREANTAKAAQAKLEAEFSKRDKDLADQGNALKAASDKFEREAPTMAESQRTARQRQLADQDRDFQRKRREFQEDINSRKNEELQGLMERANRAVRQVAEQDKYDVILQEAAYLNPKYDVTDKVIKAINAMGPGSVGPSTGAPSGTGLSGPSSK